MAIPAVMHPESTFGLDRVPRQHPPEGLRIYHVRGEE